MTKNKRKVKPKIKRKPKPTSDIVSALVELRDELQEDQQGTTIAKKLRVSLSMTGTLFEKGGSIIDIPFDNIIGAIAVLERRKKPSVLI